MSGPPTKKPANAAVLLRGLQKIKPPKRSFVVNAQRNSTVNVGAYCIRPRAQAFTPTDTFLSVERLEDLYFAIPLVKVGFRF